MWKPCGLTRRCRSPRRPSALAETPRPKRWQLATYGGTLDIGTSGTLTLTGATAALGNTAITGSGTLKLAQGSSLELAASSSMDGVLLELDGQLTANSDGNVSGLTGAGALTLNGHNFTVNAAREPPTSMKARWEKER